jgi:hypothetical protein
VATPRFRVALLAIAVSSLRCGPAVVEPEPRVAHPAVVRSFDYVAPDGARLASATTRGRCTVIVLITTYDLASQLMVRVITDVVRRHRPRINAGAVVLEPPNHAPLVEAFIATMDPGFPIALADPPTLEARGPFGDVRGVPTTVVLDPSGIEVARWEGAVAQAVVERAVIDATH